MVESTPGAGLTQVVSDWQSQFPDLKRHKGGQKLLKRVGGIVLGVELEKFSSAAYRPSFVLYNLFDATLSRLVPCVDQKLSDNKGLQIKIEYRMHSRDYLQACGMMRTQAKVRLDGCPTLEDVIHGILRYIDTDLKGANPFEPCKAVMLLSRFVRETKYGEECFQAGKERLLRFPAQYLDMQTGGTEQWIEELRKTAPEQLVRAVDENVARFKLESVPVKGDMMV